MKLRMKDPVPSKINLKSATKLDFLLARNYTNVTYILNQANINFTENYTLHMNKGDLTPNYAHLNVDGLSLWYQMSQRRDFFKAFEAMLKIRNQFVNEFFQRIAAYQAYHYIFKNKQMVLQSVLGVFDAATAESIY